jgi:hypothetical protein
VLPAGTYNRLVVDEGTTCVSEGPLRIRGGLFIEDGATFVLGSEESPGSTGTISGGVHATNPAAVQIHFATVNGGIDLVAAIPANTPDPGTTATLADFSIDNVLVTDVAVVPEPSTVALVLTGSILLGWHSRRRKSRG